MSRTVVEEFVADEDGIVLEHLSFRPRRATSDAGPVGLSPGLEGGTLVILADLHPYQQVHVTIEKG